MSIFKDEDEKEYVVAKLCETGRYLDLANMFMFYSDLTTEDIFEFHYMTNKKFYVDLFEHIFCFLRNECSKGNYMKFAGNVLQNIYLEKVYPYKKLRKHDYKNRDAVMFVFLKDLMLFLNDNDFKAELSFTLNTIVDNEWVDKNILKEILKTDVNFNNQFIVDELVDSHFLTIPDIMDIIENRFEFTTNEDILDLFRKLYTTESSLIEILEVAKSKFEFRELRNGRIKVVAKTKGKVRRFYDLVRQFLTEVIVSEVEVDMWDYINNAEMSYIHSKDLYYLDLFNKVKNFLGSSDRRHYMVNLFNIHGQEEFKDFLTYDEIVAINNEINTARYIYHLEIADTFKYFVRLFNINRFGFLSYDRSLGELRKMIYSRETDIPIEVYYSAVDKNTYNLLLNY